MPKQLTKIAHDLGAFFYQGAWRFPSVWAKEEFQRRADALGYIAE
ncbi:hypothetical protein POK33_29265 [Burkholderia cenocepacia]|nr:hypothetical protein [Burkholderia cenocepacia]MDF0504828.1 hypothetical protein [Burkholderia cenocepacia]